MSNTNSPIILFDVDKTLIDTSNLFKNFVVTELKRLFPIPTDSYLQREDAYKKSLDKYTDFEPISFLKAITHLEDVGELAEKTVFNRHFHEQAVFADVIPTLASLSEKFRLGVFSEANLEWQMRKLELSGILHFFEPEITFILRRKTEPDQLKLLPKNIVIVDDNIEVISALEKAPTVTPIWINRLAQPSLTNVPTITTLHELQKVLTNIGTHV